MSHRGHERRFDWDEAVRLRSEGLTCAEIGARLGVSGMAVYRVVVPGARERMNARAAAWKMSGACPDCGTEGVSRQALDKPHRCVECAHKAQATSVRDGEQLCWHCKTWKPDADFPRNRAARVSWRGRHHSCRVCQTTLKAAFRNRTRVPCVSCGALRSHPRDRGSRGAHYPDTGLCVVCCRAQRGQAA